MVVVKVIVTLMVMADNGIIMIMAVVVAMVM